MNSTKPIIACIVGPTACGKTNLSIACASALDAEIVSADSVQVYRLLDIGSAKPTQAERKGIPHHLIDCVDICDRSFSVSSYRSMAIEVIDGIIARGKLPLIVGGSGLYLNALTFPLNFAVPSDAAIRETLSAAYDVAAQDVLSRLQAVDPITAARLHPNDKKRIVRALEVYLASGKPLSAYGNDFSNQEGHAAPFRPVILGLQMEREKMYSRINARVDLMLQQGLLEEVRTLFQGGEARDLPALQSIGYRQLLSYFDGNCSLEDAVYSIKQETRRYAKRQMTWFKRDTRIHWLDALDPELTRKAIDTISREIVILKGQSL